MMARLFDEETIRAFYEMTAHEQERIRFKKLQQFQLRTGIAVIFIMYNHLTTLKSSYICQCLYYNQ